MTLEEFHSYCYGVLGGLSWSRTVEIYGIDYEEMVYDDQYMTLQLWNRLPPELQAADVNTHIMIARMNGIPEERMVKSRIGKHWTTVSVDYDPWGNPYPGYDDNYENDYDDKEF